MTVFKHGIFVKRKAACAKPVRAVRYDDAESLAAIQVDTTF
jgi:hypothetical protein